MIRSGALVTMGILLASAGPLQAQQLQGADAAIRALKLRQPANGAKATDPSGQFREDLRLFRERVATLPPDEAAKGWLALVERSLQLKDKAGFQPQGNVEPLQFTELLQALPPPAAWDILAAAIAVRKPAGGKKSVTDQTLLLLAHTLTNDEKAQWKDLDALGVLAAHPRPELGNYLAQQVLQVSELLIRQSGDPVRIVQGLDLRLAAAGNGGGGEFEVPDLVTLLGPQKAQTVLLRILVGAQVQVDISSGDATQRLARKLALENIGKLKAPQWKLAHSLDAIPLYEAMEKRFPSKKAAGGGPALSRALAASGQSQADPARLLARSYYVLGLIVAGRSAEAAAQLPKLSNDPYQAYYLVSPLEELDRAGHTRKITDFLAAALAKNPKLPLWYLYVSSAARTRQTGPLVTLLRTTVARPELDAATRRSLSEQLYVALLAADQVDEAIVLMRRLIKEPLPAGSQASLPTRNIGVDLARIGRILNRSELIEEGLKASAAASAASNRYTGAYQETEHVALLMDLNRPAAAEEYLIGKLAALAQNTAPGMPLESGATFLGLLASVYHETGRSEDVLVLLNEAPNWAVKDLSELLTDNGLKETPLGYMAASAFAARGEKAQALRVLEALLLGRTDFDPAYALLLELRGAEALPLLDRLYARDQFQERPLIWKAQVLLNQRRLDEAEKVVRQAIAIDPSDGEQHNGRRMRVYTVLSEILEARGDAKQAALFRGAVAAIRIAERADGLREAGLLTRAIKLYEEALTHFQDAYCIQSRLAVQLAEQGRTAEAEAHYRRAFELMPDSFGRMETHCLGCEGIFRNRQAETIAEGVFRNLTLKSPEKPQLHYLLGYLREQQGRYPEAVNHFREAVKLDPDYINAWKHILDVATHVYVPQATRDAATLNLARLDPFKRHAEHTEGSIADLRALWTITEATAKTAAETAPSTLYPLRASKLEIEKQEAQQPDAAALQARRFGMGFRRGRYSFDDGAQKALLTPAEAVAAQPLVAALAEIIDTEMRVAASR